MGRYGNERTAFAIDNFLNDLPELILKNRLASMELAARREEAETARQHDFDLLEEKEKMAMSQLVYETAANNLMSSLESIDRQIDLNESKLEEREFEINKIADDFPAFNTTEYTGEGYRAFDEFTKEMNKEQIASIEILNEQKNRKQHDLSQINDELEYINDIAAGLSSLELEAKKVGPDMAPDGVPITNKADFQAYFDEVLSVQLNPDGTVIAGTEDRQFNPEDPLYNYYKQVFIDTFSPSAADQEKQRTAIEKELQSEKSYQLQVLSAKGGIIEKYNTF